MTDAVHKNESKDFYDNFIGQLARMKKDAGGMAVLRRSLAYTLGAHPPAFRYVEPLLPADCYPSARLAMYLVAGLYARSPTVGNQSFASAFAGLFTASGESSSVEKRFLSCLSADEDSAEDRLRAAAALLASKELHYRYAQLARDVEVLLNPYGNKEFVRARWARDFYEPRRKLN